MKLKIYTQSKAVSISKVDYTSLFTDKTDEKILDKINTASGKAIKSKYLPVEKITTKTILNKVYDFIKEKI